jgi:hypothetical protein
MPQKPTIRQLTTEKLPPQPRSATTDRPISAEARRVIRAAQAKAVRRARGSRP